MIQSSLAEECQFQLMFKPMGKIIFRINHEPYGEEEISVRNLDPLEKLYEVLNYIDVT